MTEIIKTDANKILEKEIQSRGLKKKFVAQEMGYKPIKLSYVLSGRDKFNGDVALRAAKALNVPVEIFLIES
ncbi:helix-turn-helix domain-containing protein [Ligilactobacillus equi]|nr:helix-turn-helix transcriptional regulator [Ligilactobacillus equi]